MYCTKCGTPNDDNAWKCIKCNEALVHISEAAQKEPIKIHNYLAPAVLTTLCCCVPLGIVAIIYSAQVNSKVASGDIAAAIAYSKKAKMWSWFAFGIGLAISISWFALQVFFVMVAPPKP